MLKTSKEKSRIIKFINQNINLFEFYDNVYLFGSILDEENAANDLDILLIYRNFNVELTKDINFIRDYLKTNIKIPIDIVVLSEKEEKIPIF